ncbi:MAG: 4-hydroxybenzoate octaprenyltransferase [Rhodospirillaceae bacterium]|nr:4-hydroxybenzoate octaprenyltransferase [Rhodospirillaceae bacterium]MDD9913686.1 4-hydroxybenzoate octaprenyltransferase [Rhodospirillaceae bacterium]MDD9928548.1 4-hydroxybenzoate octaprenyltransferase [Rhodospirillaceae bacterium]
MGPSAETDSASDIRSDHWVERLAPPGARPYLRLARIDRPIGTWLLLIPCWWGTAFAASSLPAFRWSDLMLYILFAVGALVMRGAGCCWNDIMDRDFDAKVARTTQRPIANGDLTVRQALMFMALLMLIGLAVLIPMGPVAAIVATASLVLVVIYPLMKRVTYWPQFFLGLAFNWGILVAWAAVTGGLGLPAALLYAAGIAWTLGYDTIYAHQDKEDDALIGVKSTALKFGANTKPWLWGFYAVTLVLTAAAGATAGLAWPFYVLLALGAVQLAWQVIDLDLDDPADCLAKFHSNRYFGFILLAGFVAG